MSSGDHAEQLISSSPASDFSMSKFFHDAYDHGVLTAIKEHPEEATITAAGAAGTLALASAASLLAFERSMARIMGDFGKELTGPTNAGLKEIISSAALRADSPNYLRLLGQSGNALGSRFEGSNFIHITLPEDSQILNHHKIPNVPMLFGKASKRAHSMGLGRPRPDTLSSLLSNSELLSDEDLPAGEKILKFPTRALVPGQAPKS